MLKLLTSLSLFANLAFASEALEFIKANYQANDKIFVKSVKTAKIIELRGGFEAHVFNVKFEFIPLKKEMEKREILFIKDGIFTTDIINLNTKTSMRDELLGEKVNITYERLKDENTQDCN